MHQVVVVGGGIGGIVTATHLARLRGTDQAGVILIDHNFAHAWKPMLHTFAAGTASYAVQSIRFAPHARCNGFVYRPGELARLDRARIAPARI